MKMIVKTLAVAALAVSANIASAKSLTIDASASKVAWVGKKVTGQHNGTINVKGGTVEVDGKNLTGGTIEIDMDSITVLDIKDKTDNGKLTGHLKSDDFFGVEKNKVSTFKISSAKPQKKSSANYEITGDLTIKGHTEKGVKFPAVVTITDDKSTLKGKLSIDRTKFNVRYGSGKFFENLGDKAINDNFELDVEIVAK